MNNFCKNCGVEIKEDKKFCPNCGFQLKEDTKMQIPEKNYSDIEKILAFVGFIIGIIFFIIPILGGINAYFNGDCSELPCISHYVYGMDAFFSTIFRYSLFMFPTYILGEFLIYNFIHIFSNKKNSTNTRNFANPKKKNTLSLFGFIIGIIIFIPVLILLLISLLSLLIEVIDGFRTLDNFINAFLITILGYSIFFSPILILSAFLIHNYMHNFKKKNKN